MQTIWSSATISSFQFPSIVEAIWSACHQLSYRFVSGQTLCIAQSFVAVLHLEHERPAVAVGATVGTAGHGQLVHHAEAVEAGVAADLVDGTAQDHLVFTLQGGMT